MRGIRFLHQGRSREGVDCVGLLYVMLTELEYPAIIDVEAYRRSPPASVIYETMRANFDEIPVNEVGLGDIYLMRIPGGAKVKHASVVVNDKRDIFEGIEPQIVHAYELGTKAVVVDALETWRPWCVYGFRLKGLVH